MLSNTNNLKKSILPIDETVTCSTTTDKSGPGSNGNKGVLHTPISPELEPHHQIHFGIIRGSLNKFPDFLRMGTFIDSAPMKL